MTDERKVALVTGSALNIGRAIALALASDGFRIMTTARQSETDARETARLVRDAGSDADTHLADISDHKQATALVEATVARFGRLDVLVNNASIRRQTKFAEMTPEEFFECGRRNATGYEQTIAGDAQQLADILEEKYEATGSRGGFMLGHTVEVPADLVGITELLVPELQRRGRFRTEYRGRTLRENLAEE